MSHMRTFLAVSMLATALAVPPSSGLAQAVDNGHHPGWAPDGIYFHGVQGEDVSIYSVDAEGADLRRVTTSGR